MEACGSRIINIYHRAFRNFYIIRPIRHLCSKKEDKSGPSDASSNEAHPKVNQQLPDDSIPPHNKDGEKSAVQGEEVKFSTMTKDASQGNSDENPQGKLLFVLSDIKVARKSWSTLSINLTKPTQRLGKKKDPAVEKEKEVEMKLKTDYEDGMPSAVKAVASSLGGDVKQTKEKLEQTLISIANGFPIEEPVQRSTELTEEKSEPTISMDEVSKNMMSAVEAFASSETGGPEEPESELTKKLLSLAAEKNVTELADMGEVVGGMKIDKTKKAGIRPSQSVLTRMPGNEPTISMDEVSKNMMSSVEAFASSETGEPEEPESELTKKLLSLAAEKNVTEPADMGEVVGGMKIDKTKKAGIRPSQSVLTRMHRNASKLEADLFGSFALTAFKLENKDVSQEEYPQQKIWDGLEMKELQLLVQHAPSNSYEEMIRWTEEGKLWKFPINNEADMREEENVGFHEHVFLDHLLQEGFPKKGPIRHFMDLVITGLSKNPYISVQRKAEHVNWYREYFKTNREILEQYNIVD